MDNSASMSSSTATVTRQVPQIRLSTQYSIPDVYHKRIDPEWAELWEKHGKYVDRADLVSIHEFRKNPAKYSFTYATHDGMVPQPRLRTIANAGKDHMCTTYKTIRCPYLSPIARSLSEAIRLRVLVLFRCT